MKNLSDFLQFKEILRFCLVIVISPFGLIFKAFKLKLVYIDESRIGHYFGDSIALLTFFHKTNLIFPLNNPCSPFLTSCIRQANNIWVIRSTPIKIIAGWLRNYPIFVLNLSNALNPVHDIHHFKRITYGPRFQFSDLDINSLIGKRDLDHCIDRFRKKFNLGSDRLLCFNHRSLEHDRDTGTRHAFRNFDSATGARLLKELEKSPIKVINLSDINSSHPKILNLKKTNYSVDDIIFAVLASDFYMGDSTGTTVMAQILKTNSFIYNIFPRNFEITNKDSIAWPVEYESTNDLREINIDQVNLFQTQADFEFANIKLIAPNSAQVLASFSSWQEKFLYIAQPTD